jgi:transcriptional regulator with XRE-family HTH domain
MKVNVSDNISMFRVAKGFSQGFVANKLQITQQVYSKLEKNPDTMSLKRLKDLSKILEVDIPTLLNDTNSWILYNNNQSGGYAATKMEFHGISDDKRDDIIKSLLQEIDRLKAVVYSK